MIREAKGETFAAPRAKKLTIDLTKPGARDALRVLYPCPTSDTMIDARMQPEIEDAALEYIAQRDIEKIAKLKKEVAGNVLCNAIKTAKGITGDGWKAVWDMSNGNVDWARLAKDKGITDAEIANYRKPPSRGLDVDEVAEEG
jgi:hypothetical protein